MLAQFIPACLFAPTHYHPDIFLLRDVWIVERVIHHEIPYWGALTGLHYTLVNDEDQPVLDKHGKPYIFDTPTEALAALPAGFVAHQNRESEALV